MPKAKLTTKAAVEELPNPKQGQPIYWCTDLRGFGVRVGARDKTFVLERRVNNVSRRMTLGKYGTVSLQRARQDAEKLIGEMTKGIDPVIRKREETAGGMTLRQAWGLYQKHMDAKGRSEVTRDGYQAKIDCHLSDWLDRPLASISRQETSERHREIGKTAKYSANGVMRVLRAIWRRARRQFPELPEPPTMNVDFFGEKRRTAVVTDLAAWWKGVQRIESPVRRDFYIWLAFTGCRSGETSTMRWDQIDLKNGIVRYPITKTEEFDLPLSDFLIDLLKRRKDCKETIKLFGKDCPWVFPSVDAKNGHLAEPKLNRGEKALFTEKWSPHTLRHSWITASKNKAKIPDAHSSMLTNHKIRFSINGDVHEGYNHPDLDDLRKSQQAMTDYILTKIHTTPTKGKKRSGHNVVPFTTPNAA
jgi:integrase